MRDVFVLKAISSVQACYRKVVDNLVLYCRCLAEIGWLRKIHERSQTAATLGAAKEFLPCRG
jgi:hypothetical protein